MFEQDCLPSIYISSCLASGEHKHLERVLSLTQKSLDISPIVFFNTIDELIEQERLSGRFNNTINWYVLNFTQLASKHLKAMISTINHLEYIFNQKEAISVQESVIYCTDRLSSLLGIEHCLLLKNSLPKNLKIEEFPKSKSIILQNSIINSLSDNKNQNKDNKSNEKL